MTFEVNINSLPHDVLTKILASSGNTDCTQVCKRWQTLARDIFWTLQQAYAANRTITAFMKDVTGTDEEIVKGTVIKIAKSVKEAGIIAGIIEEITDISAEGLEPFIQDLNLSKFYSRFPRMKAPIFSGSVAHRAASIRCWMKKSQTVLDQITELDLTYLNLIDIPPEIALLKNLQGLNLSYNEIRDVAVLETLTALKRLFLSGNQIRDVGPLGALTALQELDLTRNRISDVTALRTLTALQRLRLSQNRITDVRALETLTALQTLVLDRNLIPNRRPHF